MRQLIKIEKILHFLTFFCFPLIGGASDTIQLLFVGDIMQHMPQINSAYRNGAYNYEPCFQYIKDEISSVDLAFGNLEVPLGDKPYSGYPMFCAPDEIAVTLVNSGFDVLVTANNHSCDRNKKGITRTINVLDTLGIMHTGVFTDSLEKSRRYPLFFEKNNFKIALINYTYGTNGLPIPDPCIVNLIDTAHIAVDIQKCKDSVPDLIIAFMHWGDEYARMPNKVQKMLAEFMFSRGVNLVIGSHPHVLQPMEKRYAADARCDRAIVYSLGNFVSNQSKPHTDGGAMLKLNIQKDSCGIHIFDAAYSLVWVYKPIENKRKEYYILPAASFEDKPDFMNSSENLKLKSFLKNSRELLNKNNIGIPEYSF